MEYYSTFCGDMGLITERTKAIIVVHLYGTIYDMGKVIEIAKKHNLKAVEDCAQCFGANQFPFKSAEYTKSRVC